MRSVVVPKFISFLNEMSFRNEMSIGDKYVMS